MAPIQKHPVYMFVLGNVSVLIWAALLHHRLPAKLMLMATASALALMNLTLLFARLLVKRRNRSS